MQASDQSHKENLFSRSDKVDILYALIAILSQGKLVICKIMINFLKIVLQKTVINVVFPVLKQIEIRNYQKNLNLLIAFFQISLCSICSDASFPS